MVAFNTIPTNLRIPFVAVEFDASSANQSAGELRYQALIIGQKLAAGTGTADTVARVAGADQVGLLAGRGSMLHRQALAWFASNQATDVYIGLLDDDGAGAFATGTITVSGAATEAGTIALYLGGERVTVGVESGDVANDIAAAIDAAINAAPDLPVTSGVAANVATVTFRHRGEVGNHYNVRHSFQESDGLPAGVSLAIVQLTGGAANPDLTALLAALGDMWFQIWAHPYIDATSLTAIETELAARWDPMRAIDGQAFTSAIGSLGTLAGLGNTRNSKHSSIVAQDGEVPLTPPMEFAAECAALVAAAGAIDPARPFQTLALSHAIAIPEAERFMALERNSLLFDGIATTRSAAGGVVQLERMITTFQENASAAPDDSFLDVNTLLTLMLLRYSFRVQMQSKYPRHKLADTGTKFRPGQFIMTPKIGKAEALAWFLDRETAGLVEGYDVFRENLVVERGANPNWLDFLLPPDLINQLRVVAGRMQFRL